MCHDSCISFGITSLSKEDIKGKKVLEVGSRNINGSLRHYILKFSPFEYVGVDIDKGDGVDVICNAEDLAKKFGRNSFDLVISTEGLEHMKNWKKCVSNIKSVCKDIILLTTRSLGFPKHNEPDYWRFSIEDIGYIFSDFEILKIEKDNQVPGVFLKAKKKKNYKELDLNKYEINRI